MSVTDTEVIERTEQPDPLMFSQFSLVIPDKHSLTEEFRKVWRRLDAATARIGQLERCASEVKPQIAALVELAEKVGRLALALIELSAGVVDLTNTVQTLERKVEILEQCHRDEVNN